jgi:hypothetical protein
MKVQETKKRNISTSGTLVSAKMGLDAQGVAMAISFLRDKIYSNKILAVLREYWANARDEHLKFNVQRPVEIQLPHRDDPVLRIRDFAQGMSEHDALKVFGQYFKSTKGDENVSIGGFGIGSKAGHAYGDAFTVTSYFEGTCSVYEAVLETDEATGYTSGVMYRLDSFPTDESGVEISMTVRPSDCHSFERTLSDMLVYLPEDKHPKVTKNGMEVSLKNVARDESLPSGNGWYVKKKTAGYGYSYGKDDMVAVMGGIGYEIDTSIFREDSAFTPEMRDMLDSSNLVVDFEIGSLAIAPSREGLEYVPKTKALIRTKLRQIQTDIETWVEQEISQADNVLRAKARLSELVRGLNSAWTKGKKFTYKGQDIQPGLHFRGNFTRYEDDYDKGLVGRRGEETVIGFDDRLYYLLSDTNAGGIQRARTLWEENENEILLIQFIDQEDMDSWMEKNDLSAEFFEDWETVEKQAITRVRTLSDGTVVRTKRSKISKSYLHTVNPLCYSYRDKFPRFHGTVPDHAIYLMLDHKSECLAVHKANNYKSTTFGNDRDMLTGAMRLIEKAAKSMDEQMPAVFAVKLTAKNIPDEWETIQEYLTRRLRTKGFRAAVTDVVGTNAEYEALPTNDYEHIHAHIMQHADMLPDEYVEWCMDLSGTIDDADLRSVRAQYSSERYHVQFVAKNGLLDDTLMKKAKRLADESARVIKVYPIMRAVNEIGSGFGNSADKSLVTEQVATYLSLAWENGAFTESSRNNSDEDA